MKTVIIGLCAIGFAAAASHAQKNDDIIVVSKPVTLASWTGNIGKQLDRTLRFPTSMMREDLYGVSAVRFRCSEDGRPAAVTLSRKSGFSELDREAVRAISRLKSLHPMPANLKPDQVYVANILFARSPEDQERQLAILKKEADRRNAWFRDPDDAIVLTIGSQARVRRAS